MRLALVCVVACSSAPNSQEPPPPVIDGQQTQDPPAPTVRVETITAEHRAVPGAMFGGWGPHLGHLLHAGETTYWVDDLCSTDCDVNIDHRVGVFARGDRWQQLATLSLDGFHIQENTAALAQGGALYAYGIDSPDQAIVECRYDIASGTSGCAAIPVAIGAGANYIGAAVTPDGYRVVWWTNVVDGGGGSFGYLVNYGGGGWNGPRTYAIGGYNACAYAHVAFAGATDELFCQVVSGLAPSWSYSTLVGTTPQNLANVVAWSNGLAAPPGDSIMSTNDLVADAGTTHLIARSAAGAAVFYDKPSGGAYGSPRLVLPGVYRARWVVADAAVALAHDTDGQRNLVVARAPAGSAFAPETWTDIAVPLPADFGQLYAIYPVARAYQDGPLPITEFAIVGSGDEHRILYVSVTD